MNTDTHDKILVSLGAAIHCPACAHGFTLREGIARQSLEELESQSGEALRQFQAEARDAAERRARRDFDLRQAELTEALKAKDAQLDEARRQELQLRQERQALEESRKSLELDVQRRIDEERRRIEDTARTAEAEKSRLREADLQKKLDDLKAQLEVAQRRAESGSQEAQGEVLEILLEEQVRTFFPLDGIEEVKKGVRGADLVQHVTTRSGQRAGTILWEAKRAQNWSPGWVTKLKEDMRAAQADVGVLVATCLPKDFEPGQLFGQHEDIWVSLPQTAIQVAALLRHGIDAAHRQRVVSANRGEKAEAVYDYLTSAAFAQKWKAIHGAFSQMQGELNSERTQTLQRWARREKQIQQAVLTLTGVAGEIQGLAQQELPALELAEPAVTAAAPEGGPASP